MKHDNGDLETRHSLDFSCYYQKAITAAETHLGAVQCKQKKHAFGQITRIRNVDGALRIGPIFGAETCDKHRTKIKSKARPE